MFVYFTILSHTCASASPQNIFRANYLRLSIIVQSADWIFKAGGKRRHKGSKSAENKNERHYPENI